MICPQCKTDNLIITTAEDSNFKIVKCLNCPYWSWLKYFNKKHNK